MNGSVPSHCTLLCTLLGGPHTSLLTGAGRAKQRLPEETNSGTHNFWEGLSFNFFQAGESFFYSLFSARWVAGTHPHVHPPRLLGRELEPQRAGTPHTTHLPPYWCWSRKTATSGGDKQWHAQFLGGSELQFFPGWRIIFLFFILGQVGRRHTPSCASTSTAS